MPPIPPAPPAEQPTVPSDLVIRPMRVADAEAVAQLTDEVWFDVDVRTHRAGRVQPRRRTPEHQAAWVSRTAAFARSDPDGCWVAEDADGLAGVAVSMRRELTWVLATLAVRVDLQARGIGGLLLEAALSYGAGCLRGMLGASEDTRALRRYRLAGFDLHPAMQLTGRVRRDALPVVRHVREGTPGDVDLMDSVDRQVRGSAHGQDHDVLSSTDRLLVVDRPTGSGYAYLRPDGSVSLLAATTRRGATDLLWEALAASDPDVAVTVPHVTGANQWALDVGLACRLEISAHGFLALRGMAPPTPYLHHGVFL